MNQKSHFGRVFRAIAAFVESLSESEIDQLAQGKVKLSLVQTEQKQPSFPLFDENFKILIDRITNCNDREQARAILSEIPNRETLAAFAKSQSLHVIKQDRREDIENKIIEFVVGAKLRSEAIRSLNMKGSNQQIER